MKMYRQKERNGWIYDSTYFEGEHVSLEAFDENTGSNNYLNKTTIPPYPKVEFNIANISHVTTHRNLYGIKEAGGFKGGNDPELIYWDLHIEKGDIEAAEQQYLDKVFPYPVEEATAKRKRRDPFLDTFTTSPAFIPESRFGNYKFTFPIKQLLKLYQEQFCAGEQPVMRIYETEIFKQTIVYTLVVHSPATTTFDSYPILRGDDSEAVCAYQSDEGKVVWRAQAICETHNYEMIIDNDNKEIHAEEYKPFEYYVWDQVTVAFHLPKGNILKVTEKELSENLTACDTIWPYLNYPEPFEVAQEKVKDFKQN